MSNKPLVSIGIPTYNRPEGLKRTLNAISSQTYENIEIIVSDNCSNNLEVDAAINEFKIKDSRVKSFKQEKNIGAFKNFQFVLQQATGQYFMWAADDDRWENEFIEELLLIIGSHSAAFCNYSVKYENSHRIEEINIEISTKGVSKYEQARNFLQERLSSLIYGLYRTSDILWFSKVQEPFDWIDCFAIFKTILLYDGYILSKKTLYTAGIIGEIYQYKPVKPSNKRLFSYSAYFKNSTQVIFKSDISFWQKLKLMVYLIEVNLRSFVVTEKTRKNHWVYSLGYKIFSRLRPAIQLYHH